MRQRMRNLMLPVAVGAAFLAFPAARTLQAQSLRGVGTVGSTRSLPSERLQSTLGSYGSYTTAGQFGAPGGGQGYGGDSSAWRPIT